VSDSRQDEFVTKIKERKQTYVNTFETESGKKVLEDLEKRAFIHQPSFNVNPQQMAFNEGQRSIVLHIQNMMKIDIEATEKLYKAQQKESDNV